jgi:hypothetical protein
LSVEVEVVGERAKISPCRSPADDPAIGMSFDLPGCASMMRSTVSSRRRHQLPGNRIKIGE